MTARSMRWLVMLGAMWIATARADSLSTSGSPSPASTFTLDATWLTGVGNDVIDFRWLPDGRLVIIQKSGGVLVRTPSGTLVAAGSFPVDTFSEKGLLGVAVDPAFASNRRLYFYYSAANGSGGTDANRHRVVVRTLAANDVLSTGETVLLDRLRGPANHDGGALDVGPDGLLYVSVGDTGCNSGQVPETQYTPTNFYPTCLADDPGQYGGANGKVLRIGLDGSIPPSNPLVGATNVSACGGACGVGLDPMRLGSPRPEIYAWGFRNPFRLWVDPVTGLVWVGDVGELSYEEITIARRGRHHGWPWREGAQGWPLDKCRDVRIGTAVGGAAIQDEDCVDPVYYCKHNGAAASVDGSCTAVTGGQIVDSCDWPAAFRGKYVFGDSSQGLLWTLTPTPARDGITGGRADFATISGAPVAIRTGNDGALYVAVHYDDRIARIAPTTPGVCPTTTSTTVSSTSTTLAPVDPCAGQTGIALAACLVDTATRGPFCSEGADRQLEVRIRRSLARAATQLRRAAARPRPESVRRTLARVDQQLKRLVPRVSRAARRNEIGDGCRGRLVALVGTLRDAVRNARAGL